MKSALSAVVSVFRAFQLCSAISSTHRDGAERDGYSVTLPTVEQGRPPPPLPPPPVTRITLCKKNSSRLRPAKTCAMVLSS